MLFRDKLTETDKTNAVNSVIVECDYCKLAILVRFYILVEFQKRSTD